MTPELVARLFPNPLPSIAEIEAKYPPRHLPDGAKVMRVAPSPTGFLHVGTIYQGLLAERIAHQSGGVFFLRIEDTDQKRKVDGALELILKAVPRYGLHPDEGVDINGHDYGAYGPYTQSERKQIYQAYAKKLLEEGKAYPCFCKPEEVELTRKVQEKMNVRPGYHGQYAKCRHLTDSQIIEKLDAGLPWVLRFRSTGDYDKKMAIKDLAKGMLMMPENDMDIVILKNDGLPTYHFAHAIDDHLMGTTHVSRGDEWISSTPLHIQLFAALGWKAPKYAQLATLQKLDNGNKRKLSKRHDAEASITYFWEHGYPELALVEYLTNILNANFEDWRKQNPTAPVTDFQMNFNKISNTGGALFDFVKLNNISKDVVARMTAAEVYDALLKWTLDYRPDYVERLRENQNFVTDILNIERGIGKQSRKDIIKWEDIPSDIAFYFDDTFEPHPELLNDYQSSDIDGIVTTFLSTYKSDDDKQTWFNKMKSAGESFGFTGDMKAYKSNPAAYKGNVSDVAKILRVLITGREQSPDLYAIMRVLGEKTVQKRLNR